MPYMYILECADGSYYTGSTWDLERRLFEHQTGVGANHTAKRLPVKLVYCEYCDRVEDAYRLEKQVQGWSRRKKQALIEQNYEKLIEYSRNYTQYPPSASASTNSVSTGSPSASTSSANGERRPLPEPVEGNGPNRKSVSTSSADALPELVEGSDLHSKNLAMIKP